MGFWSKVKSGFSNVASHLQDFGSFISSAPNVLGDTPVGNFVDKAGQFVSPNNYMDMLSNLTGSVTGQTAANQYEQSRQDSWDMFNSQMDFQRNQYQIMARDMAAAGMNPLASLGASPAQAASGAPASPTAATSTSGLSGIASMISPILGAIVSRANNADDNETKKDIAKEGNKVKTSEGDKNRGVTVSEGAKNRAADAPVKEATARKVNADARGQEITNDYSETTGITSLTPDTSAVVRDAVSVASQVAKSDKPMSVNNIKESSKIWQAVIGQENGIKLPYGKGHTGKFMTNYLAWSALVFRGKFQGDFGAYLALKFPNLYSAFQEKEAR